jgi:hypothetical protein
MGKYNRAKVQAHFSIEKMIAGYEQLFCELLDSVT